MRHTVRITFSDMVVTDISVEREAPTQERADNDDAAMVSSQGDPLGMAMAMSSADRGQNTSGSMGMVAAPYITLEIKRPKSHQAERCLVVARRVLDHFVARNETYGEGANELGIKGQYADINRKIILLRRVLWDAPNEHLINEATIETCMDLIGHLLLTIDMIDEADIVEYEKFAEELRP
jgi:hypothetical protein